MAFTYRAEWPHADATRFAVNYLRMFATDPAERVARPAPAAARGSDARGGNVNDDSTSRFTRKGLATRARIVGVAARLMFERGVANTSIDKVRSAAGVGGSQISHYFRDKRDLTRQVIASRRDDVMAFHTQPRLGALDTLEALQAWADACVADIDTVYRLGGCVYGSLAGELIEADDEVRDDLAAGYDQWLELFQSRPHGDAPAWRSATRRRPAAPGRVAGRRAPRRRDGHARHRRRRTAASGGQCRRRLRALLRGAPGKTAQEPVQLVSAADPNPDVRAVT